MSGVDDRVVQMQFDNAEFEKRLATTLKSIDELQKSLDFSNSQKGLDDLAATGNRFSMGNMAKSVEGVSGKFLALATIGITSIASLTEKAIDAGMRMGHALTDPIIEGGRQRSLNIEQAKFQFQGLGIDVDKAMKSSLDAVRGTAFGLDEAAKVAAQFGASGIKAGDQMTSALRGISGAAAMTGKSFTEIGDIFTSSAGSGVVNNQDLGQFATRGLNAAAAIAPILHKTEAQVHDMASKGQLDFKTFAAAMDQAFGKHATEANKTYAGALSNLHAALARVGAAFFTPELENQRRLFNALAPVIDKIQVGLQPFVDSFTRLSKLRYDKIVKFLEGIDMAPIQKAMASFAKSFEDGFKAVGEIIKPIKEAFREFFPRRTLGDLTQMTQTFADLARWLHPLPTTVDKIKRTFAGLFAVADIVINVFLEIKDAIYNLIGDLRPAGNGVFGFAATLGDLAVKLDDFLINGGRLHAFFLKIDHAVDATVNVLKNVKGSLAAFITTVKSGFTGDEGTPIEKLALAVRHFFAIFEGKGADVADQALGRVHSRFESLKGVFDGVLVVAEVIGAILFKVFGVIGQWFAELGRNIADALKPGDFDAAVDAVNVGLLGGILVLLKKFVDGGLKFDVGQGLFSKIKDSLDQLTGTLKAMQTELKAKALKEIAIAIAILTASVTILSLIDSAALSKAMTALAIGFGQLVGTMKVLDQIASNVQGAAKLALLSGAMTLLATAALVLAGAVALLGSMSVETLARGLGALAAALTIMIASIKVLEGDASGVLAGSAAMVAMATAMTIMAGAVALFGTMSWAVMGKGLLGVAAALGIIAGIMLVMPVSSTLAAGLAMIPLATGMVILAGAVRLFGSIPLGEMVKGLIGMAAALAIIAGIMNVMPISLPITAAGLILVGIALGIMAEAVKMMGSMDLGTLAKGLLGIAALMTILAIAVNAMSGALGGAVALLIVSHSLKVLSEVLISLSQLSWEDLAKGLVAIAAVLTVLGLAALVLEPVIPALLGLGVAMTLVGLGFSLFGVGAWLVAKAIQALAAAGTAGVAALIEAFKMILTAMPMLLGVLVGTLLKSTGDILNASQLMLNILTVLVLQILDTIIKIAPKIAEALVAIITAGLILIRGKFPEVLATAFDLLIVFLKGVRDNIDRVSQLAIDILVRFIDTLIANEDLLINEAVDLLLGFLAAIAGRVNDVIEGGQNLLLSFLAGMVNYVYRVIDFAVSVVITLVQTIAGEAERIVTAGADILIHFAQSLADNTYRVAAKGVDIVLAFLNAIGDQAIRLATGAADALTHFLNGLADAIRDKAPEIRDAGVNIAGAIISGITGGMSDKVGDVIGGAEDLGKKAIGGFLHAIHAKSPSRDFYKAAGFMAQGVVLGLKDDTLAENAAVDHAERIVRAFSETLSRIPGGLEGLDASPVITPVLDLSKVKTAANGLGALMPSPVITPTASLSQARLISTTADLNKSVPEPVSSGPSEIKFEQNIYSPTELTTNQIYRNTRSQFAQAKEELNI